MKMDHLIPKRGPVVRRRRQAIQQRLGVSGKQARRLMRRSFHLARGKRAARRFFHHLENDTVLRMTSGRLLPFQCRHPERAPRGQRALARSIGELLG